MRMMMALVSAACLAGMPRIVMAQPAAAAPAATIGSTTGQWWTMIEKSFVDAADAMPEEKWTFRPSGGALDAADGRYFGQSTRLGLATLAVWHASDHYGQLVVYLRMNGIVPPASR